MMMKGCSSAGVSVLSEGSHGASGLVLFIKVLIGMGNRNFKGLMKLRLSC